MNRVLFVASLMLVLCMPPIAVAQADDGTSMKDIVVKSVIMTALLEGKSEEVVHLECDIVATTIPKSVYREFHPGWRYLVTAFSDMRVKDLDIYVYRMDGDSWVEIARDAATDNSPTIAFTALWSAMYRIDVKAYSYQYGFASAHYGLVVSHQKLQ